MRKCIISLTVFVLLLSFSVVAFATTGVDEPGVSGIFIDPISDIALTQAELDNGYPVDVTGYVGFFTELNSQENPTNPKLSSLKLEVGKDDIWKVVNDTEYDNALPSMPLDGRKNAPGREFNFTNPWIITEIGNYTLKVTAKFTRNSSYPEQTMTENVTVTLISTINVDYPAAPAVAAAILKDAGISHRYDTKVPNKKPIYGNYISDVAAEMGSNEEDENGSFFQGIDKHDYKAYYEAVYNYLKELGASLEDLGK